MSAVLALPVEQRPLSAAPVPRRDVLDEVREAAWRSQAQPRIELFEACAMLSRDRSRSQRAFRDALLRTLAEGLDRRPVFYRPQARDLSFDERWLMALIDAVERGDGDSLAFLTASRLRRHARRQVLFLVSGLVRSAQAA